MASAGYAAGDVIARKYRLLRPIGAGGMGAVWVARNETTHAEVALKTWHDADETKSARVATAERFRHEARLAALVTHRHIVQVFDLIDEPDGSLALVMELLHGEPLDRYVARHDKRLDPEAAVAVLTPILSALAHAHRLGVVHRDVKPANVFLTVDPDGAVVPKLVDFGVAKAPAAGVALTLDGDALGTPRYMAPEQIRGSADIDGRADLFSVAVTLVELITGTSPFQASSPGATLAAVLEREIDPDPLVPPILWVELARSLAKRPFERHASAEEMAAAFRTALGVTEEQLARAVRTLAPSHDLVAPVAASTPTELAASSIVAPKRRTRRRAWPIAIGAALAFVVVGGTLAVAQRSGAKAPPGTAPAAPADSIARAPASPAAPARDPATDPASAADPPAPAADPRAPSPRAPRSRAPHPRPDVSPPTQKRVATKPGF